MCVCEYCSGMPMEVPSLHLVFWVRLSLLIFASRYTPDYMAQEFLRIFPVYLPYPYRMAEYHWVWLTLVVRFVAGTLIHQAVSPAPIRVFQLTKFKVASIRTVSDFCSEDIWFLLCSQGWPWLPDSPVSPISQLLGIYRSVFPPITSSFVLFLEIGIYFVSRIPSLL